MIIWVPGCSHQILINLERSCSLIIFFIFIFFYSIFLNINSQQGPSLNLPVTAVLALTENMEAILYTKPYPRRSPVPSKDTNLEFLGFCRPGGIGLGYVT